MSFGDLPAEDQADPGASLLGGEKRDEKVCGAGNSRAIILHPHFDAAVLAFPSDADAAAGFQRGIHCVVQKIDQKLFELIGIGLNLCFRAGLEFHRKARLETDNAPNPHSDIHSAKNRRRQLGEARVGVHETRKAVGARSDHVEAAAHVFLPIVGAILASEDAAQIFSDGFDRRERVVQLVTEHADQALPRLAFFIAKCAA